MTRDAAQARTDWVDAAKGVCIVLVVLMHSTFGVEKAIGAETWLHHFIEWARPFRMPDFFLISGLFLAARIDRPWKSYLDTKVVHFAYFYVLWLTIQFAMKAPGMIGEDGLAATVGNYFMGYVDPTSTLWFIYLLAIFFVAAKLMHGAPKLAVIAGAALMHVLAPKTGAVVIDEFTDRFVFFYAGYALAPLVFAFAERVRAWPQALLAVALALWAGLNAAAVLSGVAHIPGPDLIFSALGIAAVIAFSVLMTATTAGSWLSYGGRHSIAVYLGFTLFMGPTRIVLLKFFDGLPPEAVAIASTVAGVAGSLILRHLVAGTRFSFLFARPDAFKLPALEKRVSGWLTRRRPAAA